MLVLGIDFLDLVEILNMWRKKREFKKLVNYNLLFEKL